MQMIVQYCIQCVYYTHKDPNIISSKLGNVIEKCSDWLTDNKLSLHLGKTECMLFGPKRKIRQIKNFYVKCYDHIITSTEVVKYLGVHIDKYLNFENIVSNIVSKVNGRLKFLYRNAKCLDPRSRKTLSTALIQCYFDYSCSSWYSGLGSGLTKKLKILQNKVVRFVLDLGPRTRINCDILDSVGMLSVPDRVSQLRINHVFNIYHGRAPEYLCENFNINQGNTRGASNLNFITPNANLCSTNSFSYNAIRDWNSLPISIKNITNKEAFKNAGREFLKFEARRREENEYFYF